MDKNCLRKYIPKNVSVKKEKDLKPKNIDHFPAQTNDARTCSNCGTSATSTWRNLANMIVCNACKCFYRKHGKNRPVHMRKDAIISRQRKPCRPDVPNENIFLINDEMSLFEADSNLVAEAVCMMLEHLQDC